MKAIIPAAGQGTRLYPQTHTTPKPMIRLAGKPILGHILDSLIDAALTDIVIIVGSMKEQVIQYVSTAYEELDVSFVEQENAEGLGHAIYQTAPMARGSPLFIILGDMLFENPYRTFLDFHRSYEDVDGSIGIKPVDQPQHYGIVTLDENGEVTAFIEKPETPPSDLAISGAYIIEKSEALFDELEYLIENDIRGSGDEFQLTDALDRMVDGGATFRTFEVDDWYDCGRPDTLLEANRALLADDESEVNADNDGVIVPPVDLGDDVVIENSVVGPHVSVDNDAEIRHSIVIDSIVGRESDLQDVNLRASIIGANTTVQGQPKRLNVGDSSSIDL